MPFSSAVEVNPRIAVARGTNAPFVDMAALPVDARQILRTSSKPVRSGGSRFANGDTLFARITPCTENGKTALVDCLGVDEVATGSTEFIVLRPRPNLTLSEFTYYLAKNPAFRSFAVSRMIGTSGRQRVPLGVFDEFEVGVPPLTEQRKIVAILSSLDSTVEKALEVIGQVEMVKRGLIEELLTPRWAEGSSHAKKRTAKHQLGEHWQAVTLRDIATVVGGGTPSRANSDYWDGHIPWATPTDISGLRGRTISKTAATITDSGLTNSSARLLPPNSLLVTTRATIGACAITAVPLTRRV